MPTRRKKSTGRKSAPRSRSRSRARKGGTSRGKSRRGGGGRGRASSSKRGGRSKRPTIAKVMRRVKSSGGKRSGGNRAGVLKKATDFALNAAESALDSIL